MNSATHCLASKYKIVENQYERMKTVIHTTLITLLLCIAPIAAKAQEGLQSASIFQKYGKQKGVTMVELSRSMLESYQMTFYKSIVFKDVTKELPYILECLKKDKQQGSVKKLQEVTEDGKLLTAYYQLTPIERKREQINRFILFKIGKGNSATFIYIEGHLSSDELVAILFQKKD